MELRCGSQPTLYDFMEFEEADLGKKKQGLKGKKLGEQIIGVSERR